MQSGPQLTPDLEEQLKQQIGSLLRVALTVGECVDRGQALLGSVTCCTYCSTPLCMVQPQQGSFVGLHA